MQDMGNARSSGKVVKKEADFYVAAWMGRGLGREWMRVYVWRSSFTLHLKLSQHCLLMSYIYPNTKLKVQKNIKLVLKKKKRRWQTRVDHDTKALHATGQGIIWGWRLCNVLGTPTEHTYSTQGWLMKRHSSNICIYTHLGMKRASLVAQMVKNLLSIWETWVQSLV